MNYKYPRLLAALLVGLLVASSLFAQSSTSGALEGYVTDESGALPGVTVELSSPNLQGTRTAVTDGAGRFRFPSLPPGQYTVTTTLSGFNSVRQPNVNVALGKTATLEVQMGTATVSQEITVTAEAPVVDVTSATTGANITAETMKSIPIDRDFYSVAQVAPGTSSDAFGTQVYGSTSAENQYVIDGLNTTGVEVGTEAKILNFDYIQEVEVLTGGLPAEYGRITGGVINAITKSGGNELSGDVFGYFSSQGDNDTAEDRPATTTTIGTTDEKFDYGLDLGGYLMKDRLWFFGAYNRVSQTDIDTRIQPLTIPGVGVLPAGTDFPTDITRDIYAGKLTFNINPNHTLTASTFGDPTTREGAIFTIAGPPSTYEGTRDTGGNDYVARYNGIFGQKFLINALYGEHNEEDKFGGAGRDIPLLLDQSVLVGAAVGPTIRTGGFGFFQDQDFKREAIKLDFSAFFGSHELKFGGDMENMSAINGNFYSGGGDLVYRLRSRGPDNTVGTADDIIYYRHRFYVQPETFVREDPTTWQVAYPLFSEPETENTSVYLQDGWRMLPNLTLNLGVRLEKQDMIGRSGDVNASIDDNIAPRVGLIWDVMNNGRSKLYANFGRFYESIPMDINLRSFGGEIVPFSYNFDSTPGHYLPDATAPARTSTLGGSTTPVDPDLKGQYIDEALLGFEYEVTPGMALGVKGTYRNLGRVIEDFLIISEGSYFIANPGSGIGREMTFYDYTAVEAPEAKRKYTGVELSAHKRFSNNIQFFTSYLWSKLEGNYDGTYQISTGQLDPNINSAFDYADFLVNAEGKLSSDRTHQFKFTGSYTFPGNGMNVGLATYYASGRPLTAYGYSFAYANWEYFLTPRGSLGRGPADYEADVHVGYPIRFGGGMELNLMLDVFNVLDLQRATDVDQRYNLSGHGRCAGFADADQCNGDNGFVAVPGTINPVATIADPRASAPNPDFLTAGTAFTAPRSIRFGAKISF